MTCATVSFLCVMQTNQSIYCLAIVKISGISILRRKLSLHFFHIHYKKIACCCGNFCSVLLSLCFTKNLTWASLMYPLQRIFWWDFTSSSTERGSFWGGRTPKVSVLPIGISSNTTCEENLNDIGLVTAQATLLTTPALPRPMRLLLRLVVARGRRRQGEYCSGSSGKPSSPLISQTHTPTPSPLSSDDDVMFSWCNTEPCDIQ